MITLNSWVQYFVANVTHTELNITFVGQYFFTQLVHQQIFTLKELCMWERLEGSIVLTPVNDNELY